MGDLTVWRTWLQGMVQGPHDCIARYRWHDTALTIIMALSWSRMVLLMYKAPLIHTIQVED